ncbi:MAG: L-seryl-tRNA(Sec) selenium transferase, partial [Candidatus Aegiribacteria sp.]|nr:L-seryl-tRNA(Sec) selenium transferase [Candidatus Aegiribacteria sp.]
MTDVELNEILRKLPAVHELVDMVSGEGGTPAAVRRACRNVLENERAFVLEGKEPETSGKLKEKVLIEIDLITRSSMKNVINATGIILHTAIGRACMPDSAVEAVSRIAKGYSVLQWDCETGRRGHRDIHTERLICELAGAEAATIANNNAGATLLVLTALASGREVIVSRGQLVEIGGSFRIPDVMKQSGAIMHEVGCTNRTHLRDYRSAINENTAIILRVHPSNYRIRGFTGEVPLEQLVELGEEFGIPVVDDLGAGSYIDLSNFGLPSEPTVQSSIKAGAAVVTSSGDKLIGGPQAGIITGRNDYIQKIKKHPLARALRVGKLTIAALEASLMLFMEDTEYIIENHPLYRMFAADVDDLRSMADEFLALLKLP